MGPQPCVPPPTPIPPPPSTGATRTFSTRYQDRSTPAPAHPLGPQRTPPLVPPDVRRGRAWHLAPLRAICGRLHPPDACVSQLPHDANSTDFVLHSMLVVQVMFSHFPILSLQQRLTPWSDDAINMFANLGPAAPQISFNGHDHIMALLVRRRAAHVARRGKPWLWRASQPSRRCPVGCPCEQHTSTVCGLITLSIEHPAVHFPPLQTNPAITAGGAPIAFVCTGAGGISDNGASGLGIPPSGYSTVGDGGTIISSIISGVRSAGYSCQQFWLHGKGSRIHLSTVQ